jgi:hypothetical protein
MPLPQSGVGIDDPLASWNDGTTKKSILDHLTVDRAAFQSLNKVAGAGLSRCQ